MMLGYIYLRKMGNRIYFSEILLDPLDHLLDVKPYHQGTLILRSTIFLMFSNNSKNIPMTFTR